jgi:hypothetical protein
MYRLRCVSRAPLVVFADVEQSNAFGQREDWQARDHVLIVPRLLWIHSDGPDRGLAVKI